MLVVLLVISGLCALLLFGWYVVSRYVDSWAKQTPNQIPARVCNGKNSTHNVENENDCRK